MPIWIAIILGLVQGFTEFLPVSSSGHLALLQNLFNFEQYMSSHLVFDIALHLGTLVSVVIAFWGDIKQLFCGAMGWIGAGFKTKKKPERRMVVMLIVATLPLIIAFFAQDTIESLFGKPLFIGFALLFTATLLWLSDKVATGKKNGSTASMGNALAVGLMQVVAVMPGISRSGSTITAGLFCGFERDFAVKFAFLMSIPAVLGATVTGIPDVLAMTWTGQDLLTFAIGIITAAVSGYFAIALVKYIVKGKNFKYFAIYCACAGTLAIILSLTGVL